MSRINTNINSLIAQRVLGQNNQSLSTSLERLATGLRINRGKDDPAGLIASQNLRAEQSSLSAAIANAERADQVVNIAEGGLTEISGLMTELQSLVTASANDAGLSQEEKEANQLQIDSILQTIDRIAGATSFQGTKLLNGNFDYSVSGVDSEVNGYSVNGAKLEFGSTQQVDVVVTASAQVGGFLLQFGGAAIDLTSAGAEFVIEISGAKGSRELSFASGTEITDIRDAINSFTDVTGVEAALSGTDDIRLTSSEYGSDEFVSLRVIDDGGITGADGVSYFDSADVNAESTAVGEFDLGFDTLTTKITDNGQDVQAFINGVKATTKGTTARINTDFLDVEIDLNYDITAGSANASILGAIDAFTIGGGGADFQLAGRVDIAGKVSLGVSNVSSRELGSTTESSVSYTLADLASGQALNVADGDIAVAQKVVEGAIKEISSLRGRLGAFQKNTVGATIRSLGISLENAAAAESIVRDADFASETAALTRAQILSSSAQNALATANFQPQNALQLLG